MQIQINIIYNMIVMNINGLKLNKLTKTTRTETLFWVQKNKNFIYIINNLKTVKNLTKTTEFNY